MQSSSVLVVYIDRQPWRVMEITSVAVVNGDDDDDDDNRWMWGKQSESAHARYLALDK
jgi:hypothetical protein